MKHQPYLLDAVGVYRSLDNPPSDNPGFGKWLEIPEDDFAILHFLDQSYNGQKIGIIIEWDSIS